MTTRTKWLIGALAMGLVLSFLGVLEVIPAHTEPCLEGTEFEREHCEKLTPALVVGVVLVLVGSLGLLAELVRTWRDGR